MELELSGQLPAPGGELVLDDVRALPENVIGEVGGFPLAVLGFARQLTIVEGTSQVRLWLIARGVLDHDLRWD